VRFFEPENHKDLARCIVELYDNPQKRRALGENAYRRYDEMRCGETKQIYTRVIEDLVGLSTE
jgi:glycosyltransferase involved in cell wall biosynthesis